MRAGDLMERPSTSGIHMYIISSRMILKVEKCNKGVQIWESQRMFIQHMYSVVLYTTLNEAFLAYYTRYNEKHESTQRNERY